MKGKKTMNAFRPTAIPLMTTDPFFSIWSFADRLTDDSPRHWTGRRQSMLGVLTVDGVPYRFMGQTDPFESYFADGPALKQTSVTVNPTSTVYTFAHPLCDLTVTFLTPLLCDRPEVMSRPVSYVFYKIVPVEEGHTFEMYIDASCDLCGDEKGQNFVHHVENGHAWIGAAEQNVLNESGDDVRIGWGYLHLVHPNAEVSTRNCRTAFFRKRVSQRTKDRIARETADELLSFRTFPLVSATSEKLSDVFVFAYDDVHSVEYFGKPADAYCMSVYGSFEAMLKIAVAEADSLRAACAEFDRMLVARMEKISSEYAAVGALAYRQAVAAHKAVSVDGKLLFLSKENFSNGCMATLDVTYPSIPLFLCLNPELVKGMMRPLFAYARTAAWNLPYAPHDCGQYPLCNGQVYGVNDGVVDEEHQMPVEECGNAILVVAATVRADGDRAFAEENRDLLEKWADYLVAYGYNPGNQLCTDDFAGHLAHNCNLSLKAIVALGAYGQLFGEKKYTEAAKKMAENWVRDAKRADGIGYNLTFDNPETWSLKYNIVWDRLLGLGLFDESVSREEQAVYLQKMRRYGVPLDSRADYTKIDWLAWTTVMTDDTDYRDKVYRATFRMVCESRDRIPVTDWYDAVDGRCVGFRARSVLGGFYINLLEEDFR